MLHAQHSTQTVESMYCNNQTYIKSSHSQFKNPQSASLSQVQVHCKIHV